MCVAAAAPSNATTQADEKPLPLMVTSIGALVGPPAGLKAEINGSATLTVIAVAMMFARAAAAAVTVATPEDIAVTANVAVPFAGMSIVCGMISDGEPACSASWVLVPRAGVSAAETLADW